MTKRELLALCDSLLEEIRQRGIVAQGVTRSNLRERHVGVTAIRRALEAHMPADAPPVEQGALKGVG